jgi:hypothetical protein
MQCMERLARREGGMCWWSLVSSTHICVQQAPACARPCGLERCRRAEPTRARGALCCCRCCRWCAAARRGVRRAGRVVARGARCVAPDELVCGTVARRRACGGAIRGAARAARPPEEKHLPDLLGPDASPAASDASIVNGGQNGAQQGRAEGCGAPQPRPARLRSANAGKPSRAWQNAQAWRAWAGRERSKGKGREGRRMHRGAVIGERSGGHGGSDKAWYPFFQPSAAR